MKRHGSWFFAHDVRDSSGKRRQIRRGGFETAADARCRRRGVVLGDVAGIGRPVHVTGTVRVVDG
jgi:hypothetical protein